MFVILLFESQLAGRRKYVAHFFPARQRKDFHRLMHCEPGRAHKLGEDGGGDPASYPIPQNNLFHSPGAVPVPEFRITVN